MRVAWDPNVLLSGKAETLSKNNMSSSQKDLKKASKDFESLFIQQLLSEMRETVSESELFGNRRAEKMFETLLDEELAQEMSHAGGIGLSKIIYEQMVKHVSADD